MIRLLIAAVFSCIAAAQTADRVLLIANRDSKASLEIADYYVKKRGLPLQNVCRIRVFDQETISRFEYEDLAKQVAKCLRSRGLEAKILYLVTTLGVPLRVAGSEGMQGDFAAVDSELTLLYQDMKGRAHPAAGPLPNPFHRQRDAPFAHPRFPTYLVTRLAAYDVAGVRGMIDRCLMASNRGKFVIDLPSAEDRQGNDWLRNAAILLPPDRLVFDESAKVIYDQKDVIAYAAWGSNDRSRTRRFVGFAWLPGAIMTEYVSSNGRTFERPPKTWTIGKWSDPQSTWFADSPQSLAADYLQEGASGAAGHVYEPYLHLSPRPDYLLPAWYAGRNLAESYWLSIPALSWQNVVLGDPLCTLGKP